MKSFKAMTNQSDLSTVMFIFKYLIIIMLMMLINWKWNQILMIDRSIHCSLLIFFQQISTKYDGQKNKVFNYKMIQEHYHYHDDDLLTSVQQQQFEYLNVIHLFTFFSSNQKKRSFFVCFAI